MKRLKQENPINPLIVSQSNLITQPREDMKWLPNQTVNPIRCSSKSQIDTKEIEYLSQVKLALLINLVLKQILKNTKLNKLNETNYKSITTFLNPRQVSLLNRLKRAIWAEIQWAQNQRSLSCQNLQVFKKILIEKRKFVWQLKLPCKIAT